MQFSNLSKRRPFYIRCAVISIQCSERLSGEKEGRCEMRVKRKGGRHDATIGPQMVLIIQQRPKDCHESSF